MPRAKKEHFEWVEALGQYRKRIKDADGKYFALYATTERELEGKVCAARGEVEERLVARENPTVGEYADRWLELYTANITTATRDGYRYIINHYIKPAVGDKNIKDVTQDDINLAMLPLSKMSASIHNNTVMLYKKIFRTAFESELIRRSPCDNLKRGGKKASEKVALNSEQVTVLLDATRGTVAYTFIMVGLYAGLRREEILGLKWDCVHLDGTAPHIAVKRAVRWEHNQPVVEERLKSRASKRNIPIPKQLVDCLKEEKLRSASDFVISNRDGGPKSQSQFKNLWGAVTARSVGTRTYSDTDADGNKRKVTVEQRLGEKCRRHTHHFTIDFHVTPHILRHTYITNLFLAGVDIKTVQYLAGHATVEMTLNIYTHITQNRPADLIGQINRAFEVKSEVKLDEKDA